MKKKLAGLLAAMMVLTVGTTVFGAQSAERPAADAQIVEDAIGTVSTEATAVDSNGKTVTVTVTAVASTDIVEAAQTQAKEFATGANGTAKVLGIVDITAEIPEGAKSVDVTIKVDGIKVGDTVLVLHQKADGTWESLNARVEKDGEVIATFTSFSPVVIAKVDAKATDNTVNDTVSGDAADNNTVEGEDAEGTSPKTGAPVSVLPALALVCVAGIVIFGRKVKFN